jgi:hypothetical protein
MAVIALTAIASRNLRPTLAGGQKVELHLYWHSRDDVETHLDEIRDLLNDPDQVRVVQVRHSYRDLMALRDRVPSILGTTDGLVTWGPDVKGNCVLVRAVPENIDEVRRTLMATNPDDVRVEVGEPIIPT